MSGEREVPGELTAQLLTFLAAEGSRLARFLDMTGLTPATIRAAAAQPGFGASVVVYFAGDETLMRAVEAEAPEAWIELRAAAGVSSRPGMPATARPRVGAFEASGPTNLARRLGAIS